MAAAFVPLAAQSLDEITRDFTPSTLTTLDIITGIGAAAKGGFGGASLALRCCSFFSTTLSHQIIAATLGCALSEAGSFPFYTKSALEGRDLIMRQYFLRKRSRELPDDVEKIHWFRYARIALDTFAYCASQGATVLQGGIADLPYCRSQEPGAMIGALIVFASNIPIAVKNIPRGDKALLEMLGGRPLYPATARWALFGKSLTQPTEAIQYTLSPKERLWRSIFALLGSFINFINTLGFVFTIALLSGATDTALAAITLTLGPLLGIFALKTPLGMNYEGIGTFQYESRRGVGRYLRQNIGGYLISGIANTGMSTYLSWTSCINFMNDADKAFNWNLSHEFKMGFAIAFFGTLALFSFATSTMNKGKPAQEMYCCCCNQLTCCRADRSALVPLLPREDTSRPKADNTIQEEYASPSLGAQSHLQSTHLYSALVPRGPEAVAVEINLTK